MERGASVSLWRTCSDTVSQRRVAIEVAGLAVCGGALRRHKLTDEQVPFPLSSLAPGKRWNWAPSARMSTSAQSYRPNVLFRCSILETSGTRGTGGTIMMSKYSCCLFPRNCSAHCQGDGFANKGNVGEQIVTLITDCNGSASCFCGT